MSGMEDIANDYVQLHDYELPTEKCVFRILVGADCMILPDIVQKDGKSFLQIEETLSDSGMPMEYVVIEDAERAQLDAQPDKFEHFGKYTDGHTVLHLYWHTETMGDYDDETMRELEPAVITDLRDRTY